MAHNDDTEATKKEIEGIKHDVESLVKRLVNIKNRGGGLMNEQLDLLTNVISDLKDKGEKTGKDILNDVSDSTLNHPMRNLIYAFGIGFVLALLVK